MHRTHGDHGLPDTRGGSGVYVCPMHPAVTSGAPGRCPECGMTLVKGQKAKGEGQNISGRVTHDKHAGHSTRGFARRFWVSLVLTIPVLLTSALAERLAGRPLVPETTAPIVALVLGSVVFWYGGWVFLVGAFRELRGRLPGMMTLIGIAIVTAYVYSVVITLLTWVEPLNGVRGEPLFWELTTLITIMLLGHWMEMRAVQGAQGALRVLSKLLPDTADVVRGQTTETVPLADVRTDDVVLVRPGAKVPTDGEVLEGASEMNESLITGESQPVAKRVGSAVIAGTGNGDGVLRVRVTQIGAHTFLAGVVRLVADAQASKSRLQALSDRAALVLTVVAVGSGLATFAAWLGMGAGLGMAVERTVAVLVIACPHALGLAVPLVATISTTLAARNGLLVRQRIALEAARTLDTVLFDKTGTLTRGAFGVERVWTFPEASAERVLRVAASLDVRSEHVIAKAIVAEAARRGVELANIADAAAVPGQGMRGTLDGVPVAVGGLGMLSADERLPEAVVGEMRAENRLGKSIVLVWEGGRAIGAFALADMIRDESAAALRALQRFGIRVAMVTGDAEDVARWVAGRLGISEWFARVPPGGKASIVKRLQAQGRRVAFVGDGINDAPALTQADVGIAIGAGTNVAIESAGILLVRNDPRDIPRILILARATYRKMLQNLFWATAYNIVALPLAAGVLASRGILLQPAIAALFMSLSTVVVAVNATLLRRLRLGAVDDPLPAR